MSKPSLASIKSGQKSKVWKKEGVHFKEAREMWDKLQPLDKRDYILRRIGEEEAIGYIKNKKVTTDLY